MALDNFRTQKIIWDRANKKIFETIEANSGDSNGRKLVVQVINQETTEILSGTTLSLGWKSREGAKGLDAFKVVDASKGIFEIYYTTEMLSNIGNIEASLILIDSTSRIESSTFTISVRPSTVDDESVESENSFTALTEALVKVNNLEDNYAPRLNEVTAQLAQTNEMAEYREYITPYDYGAVGDLVADDTNALREAIYHSHITGKILYIPTNCKVLANDTLNFYNGKYYDVTLNIVGSLPSAKGDYSIKEYGGIKVNSPKPLFKNATVKGSISNLSIVGKRDENYHFFDNCKLTGANIQFNNITNFGVFLYDSSLYSVARITNNMFLTIFYFHKHKETPRSCIDSFINNNYINGGAEPIDNACFEFKDYNGSVFGNNFIDYYHTVYRSNSIGRVQGPSSTGNQYQVFKYLYNFDGSTSVVFSSVGDSFNWTDENSLVKLKDYSSRTYIGKDGVTYSIPTYIYYPMENSHISFVNAYIQSNVGNIVYVGALNITGSVFNHLSAQFLGVNKNSTDKISFRKGDEKPFYNSGNYVYNTYEPFFIIEVTSLAGLETGWSKYPFGTRVRYNNQEYRAINKFNQELNKWEAIWIEVD